MWSATSWNRGTRRGNRLRQAFLFGFSILLAPVCCSSLRAAQADLERAASLIRQGNLQEAETELREALKAEPNSVQALHLLGLVYQREERFGEAESTLRRAVDLAGNRDAQLIFLLAQTEFALKKPEQGLALTEKVRKLAGTIPAAHSSLGRLLLENGFPREAVQDLEKAHTLSPKDPAISAELIAAYLNAHEAEKARPLLESFLTNASYNDLLQAGSRWGELGQFSPAARAFQQAMKLNPGSYDAQFNLAFALFRQADFNQALAVLDDIDRARAQPQADYHYLRGKIELALQRPETAAEEYLRAIHLQPENEGLCMDAGLLFSRFEDFEKALEVFQACAERLPRSVSVETGLGLTYFQLGKYPDAIEVFKKVIGLQPGADAAREALVFLLYIAGRLEEGRQVLEERMQGKDVDYYIYFLHALVLRRQDGRGNQAAALRSLERAVQLNPNFAPAYYQRAKIEFEQTNATSALGDLATATRLDPNYAQPYSLMAQIYYKLGKKQEAAQAAAKSAALGREQEEKEQRQQLQNRLVQSLR